MIPPLLEVQDLVKGYAVGGGLLRRSRDVIRAVDRLSFTLTRGRTVAIVGESGCGKSTVARCITRLTEPTSGRIRYDGRDVTDLDAGQLRSYRRDVQLVFQNPATSLNPRMTAGALVAEPLWVHGLAGTRAAARDRAHELLELVGLDHAAAERHPHELSGGQVQRVVLARAVALRPRVLLLDEPVASLDTSIAAQILNVLVDLQEELDVAYLLISHDLSLVRQLADDVIVMYLGSAVEVAPAEELFRAPRHPYTQALLSCVAVPDPPVERTRRRIPLIGEVPQGLQRPSGCRFHPRCFKAEPTCTTQDPPLETDAPDHHTACWFAAPTPML